MLDYILLGLVFLVGLGCLTALEHLRYAAKHPGAPVVGKHIKEDNGQDS